MNLSRDSMLALQRHFLGALSAPARTWLEPLPAPPLAFAGIAIRPDRNGCVLDFGTVASPGEERRLVRVCNRGMERIDVRLGDRPEWLTASWVEGEGDAVSLASGEAGATLEVRVAHDTERELRGTLRFLAGDRVEELAVRMTARRVHPVARFDFNGAKVPDRFEFVDEERAYELSVANATAVPLVVTLSDLPAFLTCEVDGRRRQGPIEGPFFERTAPFTVSLRPHVFGWHDGSLRVLTNDPRPEWQRIELRFASSVLAARPYVNAVAPRRVRMRAGQSVMVAARLENWSRSPARTSIHTAARFLDVREWPVVPAAANGRPGAATLPIRVVPAGLLPGAHTLSLSARIEGGDPATADVPVAIDVLPGRNAGLRPETIAALVALLVLTLLFVVVRGFS